MLACAEGAPGCLLRKPLSHGQVGLRIDAGVTIEHLRQCVLDGMIVVLIQYEVGLVVGDIGTIRFLELICAMQLHGRDCVLQNGAVAREAAVCFSRSGDNGGHIGACQRAVQRLDGGLSCIRQIFRAQVHVVEEKDGDPVRQH